MSDTTEDLDFGTDETDDPFDELREGEGDSVEAEQAAPAELAVELAVDDADLAAAAAEQAAPTAPAEPTDEEKAAAEAKAKEEADKAAADLEEKLVAFKATADGVLTDENYAPMADLPAAQVEAVKSAYTAIPGAKGKGTAKQYLVDQMQAKMIEGATRPEAFFEARTFMNLSNAIKDIKGSKPDVSREKVDPTKAFVDRAAALMLAVNLVVVPEDVDGTWADKTQELVTKLEPDVEKYRTWQDELARVAKLPVKEGETPVEVPTPEISPVVLAAAKIAVGRSASHAGRKPKAEGTGSTTSAPRPSTAGSGHRGSIGDHIKEAMDTVQVGEFMTIADIAKVVTSQYGSGNAPPPSQGAIAARLFPGGDADKCNLDFVRPEGKDEGHAVKGAVRTA